MGTTTQRDRLVPLPVVRPFGTLPVLARVYLAAIVAIGAAVLLHATANVRADQARLFVVLLVVSNVASAVKVSLPLAGGGSTLSISYVVSFAALLCLGPFAIVPVAVTSAWSQCTFGARQRNPIHQTLFSMAALGVTAAAAAWAYVFTLSRVPQSALTDLGASMVAATAYFLLNTLLVAAAVALASGNRIARVWRRDFLWSGPTYYVGALMAALAVTVAREGSWPWAVMLSIPAFVSYRSYRAYSERITEEHQRVCQTADLQLSVVESLALAIEARDGSSHRQLVRMQVFAEGLARELGLAEHEVRGIRTAALLHDIGNLAVPEHVLSKAGLLTEAEFERVRIHPRVGAEILKAVPFPYEVGSLILAHHERWDGRGYPAGRTGSDIPIGARILSVVDCFTTMLADRPHRPARSFAEAIATVRENSGGALDPAVAEVFIRILPHLESQVPLGQSSSTAAGQARDPESALGDIAVAHREERLMLEIAQALGATLSVADVVALMSTRLVPLLPFTSAAVFLWDEAVAGYRCEQLTGRQLEALSNVTAGSFEGLQAELAAFVTPRNPGASPPVHSMLAAPLRVDDRTIGTLVFCHVDREAYTADHHRLVTRVAEQVAPVLASAVLFRLANEQSLTDPLTGLANRRFVEQQIEQELSRARRHARPVSVLFFDLDRLKGINDAFGHHAGDGALREVGRFLKSNLRDYDICARYAGDEFVVVLVDCDRQNAERRLLAIQAGIAGVLFEPVPGSPVGLSISGGAATFPADGANAEALIAAADRRMYEDKAVRGRELASAPAS